MPGRKPSSSPRWKPRRRLLASTAAVKADAQIEPAIAGLSGQPNCGLFLGTDAYLLAHRKEVVALAARYRLPAIYPLRGWIAASGLMGYDNVNLEQYRGAAIYVDRILKGAKPGDLPIQLPTKFELLLDLSAAKTLGREFPLSLPVRAADNRPK